MVSDDMTGDNSFSPKGSGGRLNFFASFIKNSF
jgi:hypothetical protein